MIYVIYVLSAVIIAKPTFQWSVETTTVNAFYMHFGVIARFILNLCTHHVHSHAEYVNTNCIYYK